MQVNYSPHLIDIILKHTVDVSKHRASVSNGVLTITLFKQVPQMWGDLESPDQKVNVNIRKEFLDEYVVHEKVLNEGKKTRKIENENYTLRQQMAIDKDERW